MFLSNVVKVNPLIQGNNEGAVNMSNPLSGLPPMSGSSASQGPKSFVRSRGASSGTVGNTNNILSSKNVFTAQETKKNDLQLTPQTGIED